MVREKLACNETLSILFGIIETSMLTMPQWFMFMGIDEKEIEERLSADKKKYDHYFLGIAIALCSSFLDVVNTFITR